jgi:hypothetical protein
MNRKIVFAALLLLVAGSAAAQMMGGGGGFNPVGMFMGQGMELPVASDGTVFVERNVSGGGVDLVAINADGTDRWTYRLQYGMASVAVNDTTVLFSYTQFGGGMMFGSAKTQLVALTLKDGKELNKLDADGFAMGVTAYKNGFYVQSFVPSGTSTRPGLGGLVTRKLTSIDNTGKKLWDKTLD